MAVVEFEISGRTYRVDLPHIDSGNVYSMNVMRDKVTLSTDAITGDTIFVSWSDIPVMRIVS